MKTISLISVALAIFVAPRLMADSATIVGNVVREKDAPALGQTVNVVSTPEDREGRNSKGNGITKNPGGIYSAFLPNVGDRVTGLWVTCMNDSEVADPKYVPFTGERRKPPVYTAERLTLLPKTKSSFTKSEAIGTVEALATTYELHVWSELIQLADASRRLANECKKVFQVINFEPASQNMIDEVMWTVHDNVNKRIKHATVLDASWKLDFTIAPKRNPNR